MSAPPFRLGHRRDPHSRKDSYKLTPPRAFPETGEVTCRQPVRDQGNVGACDGYSVNDAVRQWFQSRGMLEFPVMSALWTYYWGRVDGRIPANQDVGMNSRDAFDAVFKRGLCPEVLWSDSAHFYWDEPDQQAKQVASTFAKVPARLRCDSLDNIRHSISEDISVVVALPIYREVYKTGRDGRFAAPDPWKQAPDGWHAMTAVEYDPEGIWCQTSWGDFGKDGTIYFPNDYWGFDGFDALTADPEDFPAVL